MIRLGNRVNRVYPRGQPGGYAPSLNLAGWLPRGCTDVFCTQNPKNPGYPTVLRKYRVFETHLGRTQRRFTQVKPVLPNPVPKSVHDHASKTYVRSEANELENGFGIHTRCKAQLLM
jgi:hypothetical protein